MRTKAQLQHELDEMQRSYALARQDERDANAYAAALENRLLLVRMKRGARTFGAFVIPPGGKCSFVADVGDGITDDLVELWVEPIP